VEVRDTVLLIDTYFWLRMRAVRLDSGDLIAVSRRVGDSRRRGLRTPRSSSHDPTRADAEMVAGAPIDGLASAR
jgi:hypothetical protein